MTRQTKIFTGLLAGAALGAGIALILANDKNGEMKEKVSDWFSDLIANSKDKITDVSNLLQEKIAKVKA